MMMKPRNFSISRFLLLIRAHGTKVARGKRPDRQIFVEEGAPEIRDRILPTDAIADLALRRPRLPAAKFRTYGSSSVSASCSAGIAEGDPKSPSAPAAKDLTPASGSCKASVRIEKDAESFSRPRIPMAAPRTDGL